MIPKDAKLAQQRFSKKLKSGKIKIWGLPNKSRQVSERRAIKSFKNLVQPNDPLLKKLKKTY